MRQCMYKTKICNIGDLQKHLMQTWFDFEQIVIDAAIVKWRDRLRSCVCWCQTLRTHPAKLLFICIVWFIRIF